MGSVEDNQYLGELHRSAFDLGFQLAQAVAAYEMYTSTIKGDHWQRISALQLNKPAAAISGLLRSNSILAIGRIWDQNKKSNGVDRFLNEIESPIVEKRYGPESDPKTFTMKKLVDLKERARLVRENPQFKSLKRVRDKRVAHNDVFDPTRAINPEFRPLVLDDDIAVINLTAPILIEAAAMFGCTLVPLVELRQFWSGEARKFWSSLGANPSTIDADASEG